MKYKGFVAIPKWDENQQLYIGKVTNVDDDINFEGEDSFETENNFRLAVDDYIEECEYLEKEITFT